MKLILLIFLMLSFALSHTNAQQHELTGNLWTDVKHDGGLILGSLKHVYTQPLRWQKADWLKFGGVVASTGILYAYDEEFTRYFSRHRNKVPNMLLELGWYYGSPQNFFLIASGVYGYGILSKNKPWRDTGLLIISSAVATGLIQTLTKTMVGRARPNADEGPYSYELFSNEPDYHSFPSGHTILSITASHAIAKQFDNIWVKSGIYTLGMIAPVSRLWENAHWVSDVFLAGVISVAVVNAVDQYFIKTQSYNAYNAKKINWNLTTGLGTVRIVGTF